MVNLPFLGVRYDVTGHIDFPAVEKNHKVSLDVPQITLKIWWDDQVKTINDHPQGRTFGLQQLYKLLYVLKSNQSWENELLRRNVR